MWNVRAETALALLWLGAQVFTGREGGLRKGSPSADPGRLALGRCYHFFPTPSPGQRGLQGRGGEWVGECGSGLEGRCMRGGVSQSPAPGPAEMFLGQQTSQLEEGVALPAVCLLPKYLHNL